jgi:hypothetical protein
VAASVTSSAANGTASNATATDGPKSAGSTALVHPAVVVFAVGVAMLL